MSICRQALLAMVSKCSNTYIYIQFCFTHYPLRLEAIRGGIKCLLCHVFEISSSCLGKPVNTDGTDWRGFTYTEATCGVPAKELCSLHRALALSRGDLVNLKLHSKTPTRSGQRLERAGRLEQKGFPSVTHVYYIIKACALGSRAPTNLPIGADRRHGWCWQGVDVLHGRRYPSSGAVGAPARPLRLLQAAFRAGRWT